MDAINVFTTVYYIAPKFVNDLRIHASLYIPTVYCGMFNNKGDMQYFVLVALNLYQVSFFIPYSWHLIIHLFLKNFIFNILSIAKQYCSFLLHLVLVFVNELEY